MSTTSATISPPRKLPFWRTVRRAYAAPFANFGALMRAAGPWLLVLTPVFLVFSYWMAPLQAEMMANLEGDLGTRKLEEVVTPWPFMLMSFLEQLVTMPAAASIAVAWHRLLLTGTQPAGRFLLDRSVGLYAAFLLAVMTFMTALSWVPTAFATGMDTWGMLIGLSVVVIVAAMFAIGRWSLVLPAIALGRTDIGLGEAWQATQRNTWRLFWGPIVCFLVVVPVSVLVARLMAADVVTRAIGMTFTQLFGILVGIIGVGFLSFAYQHFFEDGAERA